MRTRFFAVAAIAVLLLNITGLAFADTQSAKVKRAQTTRLVALLPASDAVAVFDARRFFNDALPRILSANQPMLSEVMGKISAMENKTGIDFRKFEQVAVGIRFKQVSPTETDCEPVAVASGDINAGALVAAARIAASGAYREEKVGGKTVYIITPKDVVQKTGGVTVTNPKVASTIDKTLSGLSKEIAISTLDRNTVVLGSLARVTETIEATSHVSPELTALLSVKETAVASFAVKAPAGMANLLPLENDDLGANIDSIKFVTGSLEVAVTGTSLQMAARTSAPEKATALKDTLEGLQVLGKVFLGNAKRPEQQVYSRMIKNVQLTVHGNDVTLNLLVPQSDIDIIVGSK